jgi:hypothetical protein
MVMKLMECVFCRTAMQPFSRLDSSNRIYNLSGVRGTVIAEPPLWSGNQRIQKVPYSIVTLAANLKIYINICECDKQTYETSLNLLSWTLGNTGISIFKSDLSEVGMSNPTYKV